jgi:hypothetical protein
VVSGGVYNSAAKVAHVSLRVNIGAAAQQSIKAAYNAAGIKLMVSAFGESDAPTTGNVDPIAMANTIGQWVLDNNLDGVDVDYEVIGLSRRAVASMLTAYLGLCGHEPAERRSRELDHQLYQTAPSQAACRTVHRDPRS